MIINAHLWHEAGYRIYEEGLSAYWLFETAAEEAREGGFHSTWRPPQRGLQRLRILELWPNVWAWRPLNDHLPPPPELLKAPAKQTRTQGRRGSACCTDPVVSLHTQAVRLVLCSCACGPTGGPSISAPIVVCKCRSSYLPQVPSTLSVVQL